MNDANETMALELHRINTDMNTYLCKEQMYCKTIRNDKCNFGRSTVSNVFDFLILYGKVDTGNKVLHPLGYESYLILLKDRLPDSYTIRLDATILRKRIQL